MDFEITSDKEKKRKKNIQDHDFLLTFIISLINKKNEGIIEVIVRQVQQLNKRRQPKQLQLDQHPSN